MNYDKELWFVGKVLTYLAASISYIYFLIRVVLTFCLSMHSDLVFPITIIVGIVGGLGFIKLVLLMIKSLANHFKE